MSRTAAVTSPSIVVTIGAAACDGNTIREYPTAMLTRESFRTLTDKTQKLALTAALHATHGNQSQAARLLGLHRNTFTRYMRRFGEEGN